MPEYQLPPPDVQGEGETFSSVTVTGLTSSRLVATDATQSLASVADLTSWIAGTANQITVTDDGDGTVTLSTPQNIHTAASPTFAGATLSGLTASRLVATNGTSALASVADLTSWIAGTANQITSTSDGDGTLTLSLPSPLTTPGAVTVTGNLTPEADNTRDLGASGARWRSVYVGTRIHIGTTPATSSSSFMNVPNNVQLSGRNAANSANIDIIKVNTSDQIDMGGAVLMRGALLFTANNTHDIGDGTSNPRSLYWGTQALGPDGNTTTPGYALASATNWGLYKETNAGIGVTIGGTSVIAFGSTGVILSSIGELIWFSGTLAAGSTDLRLARGGSNTLALANSTNPQTYYVYGTVDSVASPTNYERLAIATSAGATSITQDQGGTGSARNLQIFTTGSASLRLGSNNAIRVNINTSGHGEGNIDNTYDWGTASNRFRTCYLGTALVVGTTPATAGGIRLANDTQIIWRNAGDTANVQGINVDANDDIVLGLNSASATKIVFTAGGDLVEQYRSTNAQTFNVYNTTDGVHTNYERLAVVWASNNAVIRTENGGTGTARALRFGIGGSDKWEISTAFHLLSLTDNTHDIGALGATRPRTCYLGTSLVTPLVTNSSANLALTTTTSGQITLAPADAIVTVTGDVNPEADGTRDLGIQTTAQWANLWSDLVNGSDIMMANKWRMVESELYPGYGKGWAVGHSAKWEDGKSLWVEKMEHGRDHLEGLRPTFAVTDEFIEYKGRRITPEMMDRLLTLTS